MCQVIKSPPCFWSFPKRVDSLIPGIKSLLVSEIELQIRPIVAVADYLINVCIVVSGDNLSLEELCGSISQLKCCKEIFIFFALNPCALIKKSSTEDKNLDVQKLS